MAAEYDENNIFAKIIRGEIPSYKIFETEHALAFLDAFPVAKGHCLLIPKAMGYVTVSDMPADVAGNVLRELPRLCKIVEAATGCDGYNVFQNNREAGGQVVPHAHFHVVPRTKGDNLFTLPESAKSMIGREDAEALLKSMQESEKTDE